MSEMKSRGKRIDNGEWVYGVPVKSVNDKVYMIHGATEDAINTRNEVDFYYTEVIPETVEIEIDGQWLKESELIDIVKKDLTAISTKNN